MISYTGRRGNRELEKGLRSRLSVAPACPFSRWTHEKQHEKHTFFCILSSKHLMQHQNCNQFSFFSPSLYTCTQKPLYTQPKKTPKYTIKIHRKKLIYTYRYNCYNLVKKKKKKKYVEPRMCSLLYANWSLSLFRSVFTLTVDFSFPTQTSTAHIPFDTFHSVCYMFCIYVLCYILFLLLFCSCCRCRLINLQLCAVENEDSVEEQSTSMNVVQINIKCSALQHIKHTHPSIHPSTHTCTLLSTHTQTPDTRTHTHTHTQTAA